MMSNFLNNLVSRNLEMINVVVPRPSSRFERLSGDYTENSYQLAGDGLIAEPDVAENDFFHTLPAWKESYSSSEPSQISKQLDTPIGSQPVDNEYASGELHPKNRNYFKESLSQGETLEESPQAFQSILPIDNPRLLPRVEHLTQLEDIEIRTPKTSNKNRTERFILPGIDSQNVQKVSTLTEIGTRDQGCQEDNDSNGVSLLKERSGQSPFKPGVLKIIEEQHLTPSAQVQTTGNDSSVQSKESYQVQPLLPKFIALPRVADHSDRASSSQEKTIQVTIGRIEVRAITQTPSTHAKEHTKTPVYTLDEYLRQRSEGKR